MNEKSTQFLNRDGSNPKEVGSSPTPKGTADAPAQQAAHRAADKIATDLNRK